MHLQLDSKLRKSCLHCALVSSTALTTSQLFSVVHMENPGHGKANAVMFCRESISDCQEKRCECIRELPLYVVS